MLPSPRTQPTGRTGLELPSGASLPKDEAERRLCGRRHESHVCTPGHPCSADRDPRIGHGCTAGRKAPRMDAAAGPTVVGLTATEHAFEALDTIAAGFTTFQLVNNGDQFPMGQLIRLEGGRTLGDFLVAYNEAFRTTGPRPNWATRLAARAAPSSSNGKQA